MLADEVPMQYLLTLPPRMAEAFETLEGRRRPAWFACADPAGADSYRQYPWNTVIARIRPNP